MTLSGPVLVTGAGGFIGGAVVAELRRRKVPDIRAVDSKPTAQWAQLFADVENLQLDLSREDACVAALRGGISGVFNLAADMGGMGFIENNKALCMLSVLINTNLLRAAAEVGVGRYFFASSACVYAAGKQNEVAITALREEDAYPAMPEDGYGWEKLFSERMCRHFREDFGIPTRVGRYHNVYGRKVVDAVLTGKREIEIWGDGSQTRSFMYIDDCVQGTFRLYESDVTDPVNIGSSQSVSINQLVDIVEEIAGVKLRRTYNLSAPQGVRGRNSDNSLIKAVLGWEPEVPLETGLEKTYAWILNEMRRDQGRMAV